MVRTQSLALFLSGPIHFIIKAPEVVEALDLAAPEVAGALDLAAPVSLRTSMPHSVFAVAMLFPPLQKRFPEIAAFLCHVRSSCLLASAPGLGPPLTTIERVLLTAVGWLSLGGGGQQVSGA